MRIPLKIDANTQETYKPSQQCLRLLGEVARQILAEDFDWDQDEAPSLVTLCLKTISRDFEKHQQFEKLPLQDQEYLLELLDLELPLEIVIPLINDELYWKRRYSAKFGTVITPKPPEVVCWKSLFLTKHVQTLVETAQPEYHDENELTDLELCCPYIKRLILTQLKVWKPPLNLLADEIPEFLPVDHIDFNPICQQLKLLEEIHITFGETNTGDSFTANKFKLSPDDCGRLANAINNLQFLKILKIYRSRLENEHVQKLCHGLVLNQTLTCLELSHCTINDFGCFCIAKLLLVHEKLEILDLSFNDIKSQGATGIGYALLQPTSCPLRELYLQFNQLDEEGCVAILTILVHRQQLETVSIAGCQVKDDGPLRIAQMISLNTSLKRFDISNNKIGEDIGNVLIEYLENNYSLQWLDMRETFINQEQDMKIRELLERNRMDVKNIFF